MLCKQKRFKEISKNIGTNPSSNYLVWQSIVKQVDCYGIACKICKSCSIQTEKPIKQIKFKSYENFGIGNAIVDVICKVDGNF